MAKKKKFGSLPKKGKVPADKPAKMSKKGKKAD